MNSTTCSNGTHSFCWFPERQSSDLVNSGAVASGACTLKPCNTSAIRQIRSEMVMPYGTLLTLAWVGVLGDG